MDEMMNKIRSANPIWQFGFALCSTLVVGGLALLATINGAAVVGWAELAYRTARQAARVLA